MASGDDKTLILGIGHWRARDAIARQANAVLRQFVIIGQRIQTTVAAHQKVTGGDCHPVKFDSGGRRLYDRVRIQVITTALNRSLLRTRSVINRL